MSNAIAVIGAACLLPGAQNPQEFWDGLLAGTDHRTEGTTSTFGTGPEIPGGWGDEDHGVTATRGGFVTEPEADLTGLRIPADELARADRVVRWPLHVVRQALADAGLGETPEGLARTGLVLGNYSFPTQASVDLCVPPLRAAVSEGLRRAGVPVPDGVPAQEGDPQELWPSGRPVTTVGDALGLGGPRLALDAACSSALYGIALAQQQLLTGQADVVLAGAVCAPDPLLIHLSFSDLGAYPPDGASQPFDAGSHGIVTGQGAGVLVLKRLDDAVRDGDDIRAVLESIGLTNDGAGRHVLAPNVDGQLDAYAHAYRDLDPASVDYVECHATGTPLGDGTELTGLTRFFDGPAGPPLIGSVKGNVGHLLTVAGFTSVLKTLLAIEHGVLPATPGVRDVVTPPEGAAAAARVVRENTPWPTRDGGPRRAAVSAFGFGGTNAHLVLRAPLAHEVGEVGTVAHGARRNGTVAHGAHERPFVPTPALAVTGVGARFGTAQGAAELERLARTGGSALGPRPAARWFGAEDGTDPLAGTVAAGTDPEGAYVEEVPLDVGTYRMPPRELGDANPQHLVLFQAVEEALADAGYPAPPRGTRADQLPPTRVAVVVAMEMEARTHAHRARFDIGAHVRAEVARAGVRLDDAALDALEAAAREGVHDPIGANEVLSYIGNIMSSRISQSRNLTGPSFTVSADAAAGARALQVAELLLIDPTIEAVVVGAVDLAAGVENTRARARLAASPEDLPGLADGAAAVVVTRAHLDAARSYAVIEATRVVTASTGAVEEAAIQALDAAGLAPDRVDLLELGGATAAARQQEATRLASVLRGGDDPYATAVTAASARLGDAQRAGSLASLVQVARAMHSAELPPGPGVLTDPAALEGSTLSVLGEPQPWLSRSRDEGRTAVISVPGSTAGPDESAAALVLRTRTSRGAETLADPASGLGALILPLRGPDGNALATAARAAREHLESGGSAALLCAEAAAAPATGLTAVIVALTPEKLLVELAAAERDLPAAMAGGKEWFTPSGSYATPSPIGPEGKVAFVYPGAFTAYPGAGKDLFRLFPGLLQRIEEDFDRPAERFKHRALFPRSRGPVERRELMRLEGELLEDIPTMLAAGTNYAVTYTRMMRDVLGVPPQGAFGYSLGESSMLFATGVWADSARDDAALQASPLFRDRLRGPKLRVREEFGLDPSVKDDDVWATRILLAPAADVRAALGAHPRVHLTHVNTPGEVVVAGDPGQVKALIAELGCKAAKAPANHVMHCPVVDPELAGLAALNTYPLGDADPGLELLSAYDLAPVDTSDPATIAERIAWTLRSTIDFDGLARTAYDRGFRYFVEVGPGATCTRWIGESLRGREHVSVAVDRRGASVGVTVAQVAARLLSHGVPVDLTRLLPPAPEARRPGVVQVPVGGEPVASRVHERARPVLAGQDLTPHPLDDDASVPAPAASSVLRPTPQREGLPTPVRVNSSQSAGAPVSQPAGPAPVPATAFPDGDVIVLEAQPFVHLPLPYIPGRVDIVIDEAVPTGAPQEEESPMAPTPPPTSPSPRRGTDTLTPDGVSEQTRSTPRPVAETHPAAARPVAARSVPAARREGRVPAPVQGPLVAIAASVAQAHRSALRAQSALLSGAITALEQGSGPVGTVPAARPAPTSREVERGGTGTPSGVSVSVPLGGGEGKGASFVPLEQREGVVLDQQELLEFASGNVANVFGPEFAPIDRYGTRVRLPDPPYHFVTRVTDLQGRTGAFEKSTISTEFDVPENAWFSVDGLVPCAVTIEAGQCDLLLISYLGIDFRNQGERVYRLLDSELVFHGPLPREGQTLRYDITIDRFVWNGDTLLFFFSYRCYADGELILELLDACAGFFTKGELETPLGVVETKADQRRRAAMTPAWFKPLLRSDRTALDRTDLAHLSDGNLGEVFGPRYDQRGDGLNPSIRLPGEMIRMVDEITAIDRLGGPRALGRIQARKDLQPDAWYFSSHFPGDPVLAGSLVAEGGVQLLQTYAMYLGMHTVFPDAEFQSVPGLKTAVKVRGQITPTTENIAYDVEITDLQMLPRPTVIADITVSIGGKPVISMKNFGIQVREKAGTPVRPGPGGIPQFLGRRNELGEAAFINELHLAHAAKGDLGTAMGPEFDVYADSRAPYIPNGDFQFVDRIMRLAGERGKLRAGAEMATEYDSPPEAWYYAENSSGITPNCIYMESSLQAAILLGYYLGATLKKPDEQYAIRNLDGHATVLKEVDLRGKTIRHESVMLTSAAVPGSVLQKFRYTLYADGEAFYEGESLFGYFTEDALRTQAGLDAGKYVAPWLDQELEAGRTPTVKSLEIRDDDSWFSPAPVTGLRLADGHLRVVDRVDVVKDGGDHGLGYLRGTRTVAEDDWYFSNHFHRDPVMPGSLGVEAVLQALQVHVMDSGLADGMGPVEFTLPQGVQTGWSYRGQIIRTDGEMTFDLHVKEVRRTPDGRLVVIADASVWKPGLRIYALTDVAVEVRPATTNPGTTNLAITTEEEK